ncbi:PAS domain S-box protein [Mucilaginibacter sp. HMF5004]|uniref:PAS domain S-box protein n=1 Tax=Mucilaginibacter rivuli TaxID=2857527 RepID=UPI001C5DB2CA|nr:PAS domain S-box protein [Mucilaginibacter rivuli]MBW4891168.1 PAS domain S-box protein [Mucilaginibacter rivuli]
MIIDRNPVPDNDDERVRALMSYDIMDTLPEEDYDAINRLAAYICQAPISLVTFINADRQWYKSNIGLPNSDIARSKTFCRYTIMSDDLLEVPDATKNELFADNPAVTDGWVKFYAGAPIIDNEGYRVGTICVVDTVPRNLNPEQRDALTTLAREVVSHITLRRQKRQLEESVKIHNEFFNLFNNSPEVHCIMDREGKIRIINQSVQTVLGYKPDDAIGLPIWHFFPRGDAEKMISMLEDGLRSKQKAFDLELRVISRSGEIKWISWSVIAKDESWYASGRDITPQKKILAELELLSLVASKVNNGVVISSADNQVIWINNAFEKITGYGLADVSDKVLGDVLMGELTDIAIIEKARELSKSKKSFEVDLLVYRKDGLPLWISIINSIILDAAGEVDKYVEIIIDVTAKKKAEIELIAAKEEALQLNRAKDMFMSVMSHEIRTPLNAVIGVSHLLRDDNHAEQTENLDILKFSADNLMTLINDVLDFTKIETGNIILEKIDIDLRHMVSSVVNSMQFKAADKGIYIKADIDANLPGYIIGDKTRICQILLNLVGNSVKFTEKGGITIDVKVIEESENEARLRFEVADTGIGIKADQINNIFESFKQADESITRLYGGTGLGLAITKRLVELHDSRIIVESVYGQGSKFWFAITFNKSNFTPIKQNTTTVEIGLKLNVLVADDNQINRMLIDKVLKKWGINADFAVNGKQAVDKIELNRNYDLVLMDIHMPEMDGLDAAKYIRSIKEPYFQQLHIIALTASMLTNQMDMIGDSGMNDYILKPFDPKVLYDKISQFSK